MIPRPWSLPVVCGALLLAGNPGTRASEDAAAPPPSTAKVMAGEIQAALALLEPREQAALANDPALLKQVVRLTMAQRLLLREARDNKWDERPEVKAKLERARDKALAESWLQAASALPPDYPGPEEIKAVYEAKKEALATPRQFRIAQIFIACPKNADKATLKKAEAKLGRRETKAGRV